MSCTFIIRRMRHLLKNPCGAAAVEFAFIAPVFVLFLFGIIAYGIYFGAASSLQQLTADAARSAVAGIDESERRDIVAEYVAANALNYSFLEPDRIAYSADEVDGQFKVSVSYDARHLPIWNLFPGVVLPSSTIDRQTSIRIGGI